MKGFVRCRKCIGCKNNTRQPRKILEFKSRSNQRSFKIKDLITCNTTHVTYLIECPCQLQYIGRTTRPLHVRIREHINNIKNGFPKHSLSRHFLEVHNKNPKGLVFYGIDTIMGHWRGDNKKKKISQNETKWIYLLESLQPKGLNLDIDLNCFISNF